MSAPNSTPTPIEQPITSSKADHQLRKAQSWTAPGCADRQLAWEKKRKVMLRRSKSLTSLTTPANITDHDVDELKACFDLGFGFDVSNPNPRLVQTFPALHLYYEVVRGGGDGGLARSSSVSTVFDSIASESEPRRLLVKPGEDPKKAKMRLKHWAHVVACSLRDSAKNNLLVQVDNPMMSN